MADELYVVRTRKAGGDIGSWKNRQLCPESYCPYYHCRYCDCCTDSLDHLPDSERTLPTDLRQRKIGNESLIETGG